MEKSLVVLLLLCALHGSSTEKSQEASQLRLKELQKINQENVALGGAATQIDTYDKQGAASNAIDGNRDSVYSHNSCSHTRTTTNPWWRVDLRHTFAINSITITNRGDCCPGRIYGAQIRVGSSLQNDGNDNPVVATISRIPLGRSQTFTLSTPMEGRYVNVYLPGKNKYLTLCEVEVNGHKVNTENVALGGAATQIDTYDKQGAASNAIDGNRDSVYSHNSCSHTRTTTNPWWRVDLRDTFSINSITITNRGDCCPERLDGAQIRVGSSLQNDGNDNPVVATISSIPLGRSQTFTLSEPVKGRYVNVYLPGRNKYLTLCEVEVNGHKVDTENVALGGAATQIDTYDKLGAASNAIDGNHDSLYSHNSCSHTRTTTNPWWRVDLRRTFSINSITITNRGDCCAERLYGAQIRVGSSSQNNGNDNPVVATISHLPLGLSETFTLSTPVEGRYVNVYLPGRNKYLTLCEVEVNGHEVNTENVALGGAATQIDTYDKQGVASNAIDGNHDSLYSHNSCSHTRTTTNPWWRVDLRRTFSINSITITNRGDCCAQRLDGAQIRVGSSSQNNGNNNPVVATISHIPLGRSQTFTLSTPVEGRYVNVYLPGKNKYLTLCEVEVNGHEVDTGESPDSCK